MSRNLASLVRTDFIPCCHVLSALVLGAALLCPSTATCAILEGRVVRVADGDTVTVLDSSREQHRVRLAGIDAPEKRQPFGNRSRQALASMVFGKVVDVDWEKYDRYGRIVGVIRVGDADVCLEQVKLGLAWHYKAYEREQTPEQRRAYAQAEEEARRERRGLWSDPHAMPPWEFRHSRRHRVR